ncbi:hypothetical protein AB1K91_18800 [Terribacillus sp. 179-K 1B1 HS]|uniref:hypothetical protein n=1 Tax=Terribacillus sp. 179-K 1B1 HS TaxID=3142388 RepID=UPI0039A1515A
MGIDLIVGIMASVIATTLVGGATYKYIIKKKNRNRGIIQENGSTQIAMQKSKNNSINIGVDYSENEKRNKSE